jgi:hypothetical protein
VNILLSDILWNKSAVIQGGSIQYMSEQCYNERTGFLRMFIFFMHLYFFPLRRRKQARLSSLKIVEQPIPYTHRPCLSD